MCFGQTTNTSTTSPTSATLANYADVTQRAKTTADTPYQPYTGELVAGLNEGQSNAIGQLQSGVGVANPYLNAGSGYLDNASSGLGNVQNYLQTASGLGNIGQYTQGAQNALGQAATYATPQQFSQAALQQYSSPYTQSVIDATMANAAQQNAIQQQQLSSNAIGQGAYGGDRAGVAQAALAGQQALANQSTIAGLENQGYSTALGQYNQNQANQFQAANTFGNIAQQQSGLGQLGLSNAGLYNTLGQTQGQQASAYGTLAGLSGNLGQIAQSTNTAGASAALQGSTLQQQNAQAQDTAAYQQFQNAIQYPFQTTSYLSNIAQGIGSNSGTLTTTPGASALSQVAGAATAGLGILGTTGAFGANGYLTGASGLFSDARVKDDIQPIGKTFDGQTMYRFRYKGDPTVHTGLMAQDVEKRTPEAVGSLGGVKTVDYGAATDRAADRGHFARGGRPGYLDGGLAGLAQPDPEPGTLNFSASGLTGGANPTAATFRGVTPLAVRAPQPMSILGANPTSQQATGLAPLNATQTDPDTSGGAGLGVPSADNKMQNVWLGLTAAGLGIMGGSSPQAGVNIGQGGLAGLKYFTTLQQQDRNNALAQADLGFKQQSLAIDKQRAEQAAQQLQQQAEQFRAQNAIQTGQLANSTANTASEVQTRRIDNLSKLQTPTPQGILQRDPDNPTAPPRFIPWSQITGAGVPASAPSDTLATPTAAPAVPETDSSASGPKAVTSIGNFDPPANIPPNPMNFSPVGQQLVKKTAEDTLSSAKTAYDASQSQKMYLTQMQHDLAQLPTTGWLAAGPGQQQRVDAANKVNSILKGLGVGDSNLIDPNAIASTEDMKKATGRMGFELAKSLGGREPGFIVQQSVGLNPSTENSPVGAQRLIAGLNAAAQRNIDHYTFVSKWAQTTGGDTTGADEYFNKHAPPESYANAAITSTLPTPYVERLQSLTTKGSNADKQAAIAAFDQRFGKGTAALALEQH